jgi:hypothetical protein
MGLLPQERSDVVPELPIEVLREYRLQLAVAQLHWEGLRGHPVQGVQYTLSVIQLLN